MVEHGSVAAQPALTAGRLGAPHDEKIAADEHRTIRSRSRGWPWNLLAVAGVGGSGSHRDARFRRCSSVCRIEDGVGRGELPVELLIVRRPMMAESAPGWFTSHAIASSTWTGKRGGGLD